MDDTYLINMAKTDFREGYERGDVEQILSAFDETFRDMSYGQPSALGESAIPRFREQAVRLLQDYSVRLAVIIYKIVILGDTAYDYGCHEFTLIPKHAGETIRKRERYFELWNRNSSGDWKISLFINNADVREELGGYVSHWFLSEEQTQEPGHSPQSAT